MLDLLAKSDIKETAAINAHALTGKEVGLDYQNNKMIIDAAKIRLEQNAGLRGELDGIKQNTLATLNLLGPQDHQGRALELISYLTKIALKKDELSQYIAGVYPDDQWRPDTEFHFNNFLALAHATQYKVSNFIPEKDPKKGSEDVVNNERGTFALTNTHEILSTWGFPLNLNIKPGVAITIVSSDVHALQKFYGAQPVDYVQVQVDPEHNGPTVYIPESSIDFNKPVSLPLPVPHQDREEVIKTFDPNREMSINNLEPVVKPLSDTRET